MAGIQKKGGFRLNPHSGIVQQPRCAGRKFCGIGSSIEKEIDRKTGSKMARKWLKNGSKISSEKNLSRFNPAVNPAPFQFPYRAVYARLPRPHTEIIMTFAQRRPA